MLAEIVEARADDATKLRLRFADGDSGEIDLATAPRFDGMFEPLRDPAFFARVSVNAELGTVVWPNGVDLDPDVPHRRLTGGALPGQDVAAR